MMSLKNCLIVLWVYIMYVLGLWLFLSGYLLKRIVVHENSSTAIKLSTNVDCRDISHLRLIADNLIERKTSSFMTEKPSFQRYDKAIIIIIDALSFDFVKGNTLKTGSEFYQNKMPVFKNLMEKQPDRSRLFRLMADPPTTTLQRLKGLTTGSLPTFIDVSLNFASSEITEDNLIRQMKVLHKKIVFMGDDTWESLFPKQFHRSFPYPSFNVKDLDTVDDGILAHLYEEMDKHDSDIIIAHFLGVDHCGHRYGPKHPEMTRKLQQMNDVIQNVTSKLQSDTVLFVLGDHGMTESGDHGGDSIPEITTAMFFYSHSKLPTIVKDDDPTVNQVDLVPTLSVLLGLPIPFSNLGKVITSLLGRNSKQECFGEKSDLAVATALALAENSLQVQTYLDSYNQMSKQLPDSFIKNTEQRLKDINLQWHKITYNHTGNMDIISNISDAYKSYLEDIRNTCSQKWATFNINLILAGIIVFCISIFCNFWIAEQLDNKHLFATFSSLILLSILTLCYIYELFDSLKWLIMFIAVAVSLLPQVFRDLKYLYIAIIYCSLFVLLCLAFYYNLFLFDYFECLSLAFVIVTVSIYINVFSDNCINILKALFSLSSAITVILFLSSFSNSFVINEDRIALYLLQSLLVYRFFPAFADSIKSYFSPNNKSKTTKKQQPKGTFKSMLQPMLLMCLIVCIRLGSMFYKCREEQVSCEDSIIVVSLEKLHQSQAYKLTRLILSLCSEVIPVVIFLGTMCYNYTIRSQTVSAVCVKYGIFFVCILTSLRWWLNIVPPNVVDRILKGNEVVLTRTAFLTSIFMIITLIAFPILVDKPWEFPSKEIYSGSYTTFVFIVLQLLYLVSGDAISTAIMLMATSALLFAILITISSATSEPHIWLDVLIWSLLSRHWFYSTAHQTTFTSIQWDAAFLLNHKEVYSYTLSGALVIISTFSSFIFHGLALPVAMIPQDASFLTSKYLLRLHMKYLFFFGVKLLGTICAAFVLRRHLMVWKIFSPKLLYEVIGILISMISVSIGHYFMTKVTSQYHKLIRMNMNHMFTCKEQ